jgi:hypothetical protein
LNHRAVVTNLIPCTGISLPFFSYGGTALLLQLAEMGIVLSISRDIPEKKAAAPQKTGGARDGRAGGGMSGRSLSLPPAAGTATGHINPAVGVADACRRCCRMRNSCSSAPRA